jgi:hypothetical protein
MNDVYDAKSNRLAVAGVSGTAENRDSRRYSRNPIHDQRWRA